MNFKNQHILTATLLASVAVLLRLWVATLGYNFDMVSWQIVSEIAVEGKVVYAETYRYNYGPLWFNMLAALKQLQLLTGSSDIWSFHLFVAGFLSLVDLAIVAVLWKRVSAWVALIYLFNPVSIFLTGYHSQFENLAILWAFLSWIIIERKTSNYRISAVLMGLSLMQKHLFFFFPIWIFLAYRPLLWRQRFVYCTIVYSVFLSGFIPYYIYGGAAWEGIKNNVFGYASADGIAIVPLFISKLVSDQTIEAWLGWIPIFSGFKFIFFLMMTGLGYWIMRTRPAEGFYLYLIVMLIASSAVANQYLAIPLIACAVYWRYPEVWAYSLLVILFLVLRDRNGLGFTEPFQTWYQYGGMLSVKRAVLSVYAFQAVLWLFFLRLMLSPAPSKP